jgi:hypothetical protein
VEALPYYEYEYIVQNLIDILKEKKEAEEGQSEGQNEQMSKAQKMVPKDLNSTGFKMPSVPNFSSPSFPSMPSSLKI